MKIGSQSQTLVSLNSLLDASRQQQQTQREDFQEKKLAETRESRITTRQNERDALIQQNRDALKKFRMIFVSKIYRNFRTAIASKMKGKAALI